MKFFFICLFLIFISFFSLSNPVKIDSLHRELATTDPSNRHEILIALSEEFKGVDYDSMYFYGRRALQLATESTDIMEAENMIAASYFYRAQYDSAISTWASVNKQAAAINDSILMGKSLNNMGNTFIYQRKYDSAIYYLKMAEQIRELTDDPRITSTLNNLGLAYMRMENYDLALTYFKKTAVLKRKYDQLNSLSNTLNNIGIIFKKLEKYDSAVSYYQQSLELAIETYDLQKQARIYNNMAIIHALNEKYELAESFYLKSLALKEDLNDPAGIFNTLNNLANFYLKIDQPQKTGHYLERANELADEIGDNLFDASHESIWVSYYEKIGDYQSALMHQKKAMETRIDEINEDKNDKIAMWEVKYATQKKESDLEKLKLQEQIMQAELEQKQFLIITIIIITAILMVSAVLLWVIYNRKKKAELESQFSQIEALKNRIREIQSGSVNQNIMLSLEEINLRIKTPLSKREYEVLHSSLQGNTNAEIAQELFISINTVKFHLRNVYQKLGVENRKEALSFILQNSEQK